MNWTGGTLSRHAKRGQNAVLEKQKQHFANARAKQQTLRGTPVRPKVFGEEGHEHRSKSKSFAHVPNSSAQRQSRLKAYEDFVPVVNRLTAMGTKSSSPDVLLPRPARRQEASPLADIGQVTSRPSKRKRATEEQEQVLVSQPASKGTAIYNEDELQNQRKKLLTKSDWIGLQIPNLLHMDLAPGNGKENLGNPHRVDHQLAPNINYNKPAYVPSIGNYSVNYADANAAPSESVQIRIGDDALTSRMSQTQRAHSPITTARGISEPLSSISTLLDDSPDLGTGPAILVENTPAQSHKPPQTDSPLAHLSLNAAGRNDFVEATDEEYSSALTRHWSVSSEYVRAATTAHDPKRDMHHREAVMAKAWSVDTRGDSMLDSSKVAKDEEDEGIVPHKLTEAAVDTLQRQHRGSTEHVNEPKPFIEPPQQQPHPHPHPQLRPSTEQLRKITAERDPVRALLDSTSKPISTQAQSTMSQAPATPASLTALNALCAAKAPEPVRHTQESEDDLDAIWKAFVFGNTNSPQSDKDDGTHRHSLINTTRSPAASMECRPSTPIRRHRSSSLLTSIPSESSHADVKTTAANPAQSSSSAFQSHGHSHSNRYALGVPAQSLFPQQPSPTKTLATLSDFDRVSSIANASVIPAVLRTDRPVLRQSSPDPLIVGHDSGRRHAEPHKKPAKKHEVANKPTIVFSRPRRFEGAAADAGGETHEVVSVGPYGGVRAKEILRGVTDAGGEERGNVDEIEDA